MTDKLKPCPFCGSKYISIILPVETEYQVQCGNCYASSSIESTAKKAIKAWNHRTPSDHIVATNKTGDNPPLTLEELRNLALKEAVYAVSGADKGHWCVIDTAPRFGGGTAIIAIYGRGLTLGGDDYGDSWLAYRHKPEEPVTNRNDLRRKPEEG